jgi:type II secretory pathway predicted ATPase ExeA
LPSHEEAVARLVHAIATTQRCVRFTAAAGLGKTVVLNRAFSETRTPKREFGRVSYPGDTTLFFAQLAERLGQRVGREPSRLGAWQALERALRVSALCRSHIIVAVDDCARTTAGGAGRYIDSLVQLGQFAGAELTIIHVARAARNLRSDGCDSWALAITLAALTRSQAEDFLTAKLASAGSTERIFTARAITRLHALSRGVPRKLEELAVLCLLAGAARGLEVIPPELVDGIAGETAIETCGEAFV